MAITGAYPGEMWSHFGKLARFIGPHDDIGFVAQSQGALLKDTRCDTDIRPISQIRHQQT